MKLRAGLLAVTVVAAVAPLGSMAFAAAPGFVSLSDPSASIAPSASFVDGCTSTDGSRTAVDVCMSVAIPDFNAARAGEGLTPLVLPNDFDLLSVPEQLLALTNIERVDRDLAPVPALSSTLNSLAQTGANAGQDPAFPTPFDGTSAGSNWFAGTSSLLAVFEWMYDDGPGSGNGDCTAAGQLGCWGHRHTILGTGQAGGFSVGYDNPIAMGAAIGDGSVTELLVGGDTTDKPDGTPTWDQIVGTSTFGVDKTNGSLAVEPGDHASLTVTATSASVTGPLSATITSGEDQWAVSPSTCNVTPGSSCTFTVTFSPLAAGRFPGLLAVSSGLTLRDIALAGIGTAPRVLMNLSRVSLRRGQTLTIFGTAQDATSHAALAGIPITLQSRPTGSSPWQTLSESTSGRNGDVTFRIHPTRTAAYRLVSYGANGKLQSSTQPGRVRVF